MPVLYKRQIEVRIAGLTISEPRITVEIERQMDRSQDRGEVGIYNLKPANEQRIHERGGPIVVSAGYPETTAIIFDGEVQRVVRARNSGYAEIVHDNLARITKIKLGDLVRHKSRLGGTYEDRLSGHVSVRRIVERIVAAMNSSIAPAAGGAAPPRIALGPLTNIPPDATVKNWYWGGQPAASALDSILARVECRWFEEDGLIRINRVGMSQSDAPALVTSPRNGLLGRPTETDEGAEVRMLLNPAVKLGAILEVQSKALNGRWKVVGVRHSADNWSGKFQTACDLRALE